MRRALVGLVVVGACYRAGELPDGHAPSPDAGRVTDAVGPPDAPSIGGCVPLAGSFTNATAIATSPARMAIASVGAPMSVITDDGAGNIASFDLSLKVSTMVVQSAAHPALDATGTHLFLSDTTTGDVVMLTGSGPNWAMQTKQLGFASHVLPNPPAEVGGALRMVVAPNAATLVELQLDPNKGWSAATNIVVPDRVTVIDPALSGDGQLLVFFATGPSDSGIYYAARNGSGVFDLVVDSQFQLASSQSLGGFPRSPVLSSDCKTLYAAASNGAVDAIMGAAEP